MKRLAINKTFTSLEACRAWEDENLELIAAKNGGVILMVMHEDNAFKDEVVLTEVVLA